MEILKPTAKNIYQLITCYFLPRQLKLASSIFQLIKISIVV